MAPIEYFQEQNQQPKRPWNLRVYNLYRSQQLLHYPVKSFSHQKHKGRIDWKLLLQLVLFFEGQDRAMGLDMDCHYY